jgi:hypothetical protein
MRTIMLLFLAALLNGCGGQPLTDQTPCCNAPTPGSVSVHLNGEVTTSIGIGQH